MPADSLLHLSLWAPVVVVPPLPLEAWWPAFDIAESLFIKWLVQRRLAERQGLHDLPCLAFAPHFAFVPVQACLSRAVFDFGRAGRAGQSLSPSGWVEKRPLFCTLPGRLPALPLPFCSYYESFMFEHYACRSLISPCHAHIYSAQAATILGRDSACTWETVVEWCEIPHRTPCHQEDSD